MTCWKSTFRFSDTLANNVIFELPDLDTGIIDFCSKTGCVNKSNQYNIIQHWPTGNFYG